MSTTEWIILAIVVAAIVVVAAGWFFIRYRRTHELKEQFGPEYERTVRQADKRSAAEAELRQRTERVAELNIHPLSNADRVRFADAWHNLQPRFVDDPSGSVVEADQLVTELMNARGYPMADFDQRAADISVDHPNVVSNYREAHRLAIRNANGEATTEELRRALIHYRSLFDDLLETGVSDSVRARLN